MGLAKRCSEQLRASRRLLPQPPRHHHAAAAPRSAGADLWVVKRLRTSLAKMPLKRRIPIFTFLWLLAGFVSAVFAEFSVEAGESEFAARASMVYLAPLCLAQGVAFLAVPGGYNAWQGRQFWEQVVGFVILAAFVIHAVVALSRSTRRQLVVCLVIQVIFLSVSVAAYLYYWRWDAPHMHG